MSFPLRSLKVVLALVVLASILLLAWANSRMHYRSSFVRSQATALHPLRIVRSPQAPKVVRPVHPAAVPVISPVHHLIRPATPQHKV